MVIRLPSTMPNSSRDVDVVEVDVDVVDVDVEDIDVDVLFCL